MIPNEPNSLDATIRAERGLAILRLLNGDLRGAANDRLLAVCLAVLGFRCGRVVLCEQLDALERGGLIKLERQSSLVVLELTRLGAEVADGVERAVGVAVSSPECPY